MLRKNHGFTLIELMVVVAIIGILAAVAAPAFVKMLERNRLKGAAEGVFNDLQLARTEAIKRNRDVKVTFSATGPATSWCYGTQEVGDCDCGPTVAITDPAACQLDGIFKITRSTDYPGVSMTVGFAGTGINQRTTGFNARQGTAETGSAAPEDGSVTLTLNADTLQVRVAKLGRVRICTTTGMPGYEPC